MLALEVEYLMGRVIASSYEDRRKVEWPPHPARLFAALVAAFKECDLHDAVRKALHWLEALPEPHIYANPYSMHGLGRDVHEVFVPVNDPKKNTKSILPDRRSRQPRCFPAFTPTDSRVYFIWEQTPLDDETAQALQEAAQNVTYLGHSMSPVRILVRKDLPESISPTLTPNSEGKILLRTTAQGRLASLENLYTRRQHNASLQPSLGRITEYKQVGGETSNTHHSLFQRIYVLRKQDGCRLPLESAYGLCALVRKAVMECCLDPLPEIISGHLANGEPSKTPHMAVVPLPNIGHRHADGHIMGFAILLPETINLKERKQLEIGLDELKQLHLGKLGEWRMEIMKADALVNAAKSLKLETYTHPSKNWASITPVAFGHFPKDRPGKNALAIIAQACADIGLPPPNQVNIVSGSRFNAVPLAKVFKHTPDIQRIPQLKDKLLAHIELSFDQPVQGPVILGAGRFLGLGLCRPYHKEAKHASS